MAYVTVHAAKRTKERVGLPKRATVKNAEKALNEGIRHKDTSGSLHRYIEALYWKNQAANNIRVYCGNVYIFHDDILITVLSLPQKYRKTAERLWKELRQDDR